jgi:glycosyltransferase involved in cell wall biosynthesis
MLFFYQKPIRKFCNFSFKRNFVVYNGVDLELFKFSKKPKDYFLWVGRVEPYKGIENAIYVAKKTKIKLLLVGKVDPERKIYFEEKIKPNLGMKKFNIWARFLKRNWLKFIKGRSQLCILLNGKNLSV